MNEDEDPLERDARARELARRLLETDFSAESRIRASLRARLLRGKGFPWAPVLWPSLAAAIGAALILVRHTDAPPAGRLGLPVLSGRFENASAPADQEPLFAVASPHETEVKNGRVVEWDLPQVRFRIETRRIAPADLFENPKSRGVL